jgi:amino acid transporter
MTIADESVQLKENSVGAFGIVAQSVGASSPEIAASATTISVALIAGAGAPSSFLLGGIAVACLAVMLAYLSRRVVTAGGLAGLVEATLGQRFALATGWASLLGIGLVTGVNLMLGGLFATLFFSEVTPHTHWLSSNWVWWAVIIGVAIVALSIAGVRPSVVFLFAVSVVGIACLTILAVAILVNGGAHGVAWSSLVPGHEKAASLDSTLRAIGLVVIGFQGFESATSLGEETSNPRRTIPRVIITVVLVVWVLLLLTSLSLVTGFGTSKSGIAELTALSALSWLVLAQQYLAAWFGHLIVGILAVSCFACGLGLMNEMSRMFWSLSRDGLLPRSLSRTTRRTGAPWVAVLVLTAVAAVELIGAGVWKGSKPLNVPTAATWIADVAAPGLLIAYILAAVGGAKMAFQHKAPFLVRVVCPLVVVVVFGISLYHQFSPLPPSPYKTAPFLGLGLLVIGGAAVYLGARTETVSEDTIGSPALEPSE